MPRSSSSPRRSRLLRVAAALAVLVALAGYLAVQYLSGNKGSPRCTVGPADGGEGRTYELSPDQAANAATISAVGTTRGLPERAVTIALATALQESALRNLDHGDRDSLGLFQQRPSQGWGTPAQVMDPVYASGKFYEHLAEVPGYSRLPLTVAAQRVQKSGFPQAYAKHEPDATLLAAALTGRAPASLTCSVQAPSAEGPGDAAEVRSDLVRAFGKDVLPSAGSAGSSAAGTVSVPVRAGDGSTSQHGWELAHWAVARAGTLRITEVSYAGRVWTSDTGWRTERKESGATTVRMRLAQ
uniref:ARB-07466-like C-terminal domain-containing protein n=1 Tax=Streptomyces sp. NBC_00148 TaxID=2903626 RepID=A0AAU1LWU4_9ACTN